MFTVSKCLAQQQPDFNNLKQVTVLLERGDPMGGGPSYRLEISGDGTVRYTGLMNVFVRGKRTGRISEGAFEKLLDEFRSAHFAELHDDYPSPATDQPWCVVTVASGSYAKRISEIGGQMNRVAPENLIRLEDKIDELANSKKWVRGSRLRRLLHWR